MEYGILVVEGYNGTYQIIGAVDSVNDAKEMADNYIKVGPDNDWLCPEVFVINRRGTDGAYTIRETMEFESIMGLLEV